MKVGKVLEVKTRREWREWLKNNFHKEKEIWLAYPKKHTGKERISYNDAVEEALCFGWIDSIVKTLDTDTAVQRFSSRKPKSDYSQPNIERLKWLASRNKLHPLVRSVVKPILKQEFIFPPDIIQAIKKNEQAWKHYQHYSPAYRRIRVAYIEGARKRPEEFKKRLAHFIAVTEKNKLPRAKSPQYSPSREKKYVTLCIRYRSFFLDRLHPPCEAGRFSAVL